MSGHTPWQQIKHKRRDAERDAERDAINEWCKWVLDTYGPPPRDGRSREHWARTELILLVGEARDRAAERSDMRSSFEIQRELDELTDQDSNDHEIDRLRAIVNELLNDRSRQALNLRSVHRLISYAQYHTEKGNHAEATHLLSTASRAAARAEGCESAGDPRDGGDTTSEDKLWEATLMDGLEDES